jgi:hypothetical protein
MIIMLNFIFQIIYYTVIIELSTIAKLVKIAASIIRFRARNYLIVKSLNLSWELLMRMKSKKVVVGDD